MGGRGGILVYAVYHGSRPTVYEKIIYIRIVTYYSIANGDDVISIESEID